MIPRPIIVIASVFAVTVIACGEPADTSRTPEEQPAPAATRTHRVKMAGVVYCNTRTGLRKAWAEPTLTDAWLSAQGCGYLREGEQVMIEVRDEPMIRLNGGRWTSALAVEPL